MNSETGKLRREGTKVNGSLSGSNCWKSQLQDSLGVAKAREVDRQMDWKEIQDEARLLMGKLEMEMGNHAADIDVVRMLRRVEGKGERLEPAEAR